MGSAEFLGALAGLLWAFGGGAGALAVSSPSNIVIDSYNFNTSVRWDYENVSSKTFFTVNIECYGGKTLEVENCVNITQRYCDITHKIDQSCDLFWVKVKALNGSHESDYNFSGLYHVFANGRIGLPKFNCYIENHEIIVDIDIPLTPYGKKDPLTLRANITDFTYKAFLWEKGHPNKRQGFEAEECSDTSCTINISVPSLESSYCVSVQGFSEEFAIQSEESEERCIEIPAKPSLDLTVPITLGVLGILLLAVTFAGIYIWFSRKQRRIKLPKSLAAVVRNMNPVNFDPKPEARHPALITEPDITSESDPSGEVNTTGLSGSDQEADTLHSWRDSSLHEGSIVEISEGEQCAEENHDYFREHSGQEEMGSSVPNPDLPNADEQKPALPDSCRYNSGYDKRCWLPPGVEEWLNAQSSSDTPEA